MRFFSFTLLIGGGSLLGHLYVYLHLHRVLRHRALRALLLVVFVALSGALVLRRRLLLSLDEAQQDALFRAMYVWLGLLLCLVVALASSDLVRLLRWGAGRLLPLLRRGPPAPAKLVALVDPARRALLAQAASSGVLLAGAGLAGYGSWRAFSAPEVTELVVRLPRLPPALDGLTIVQLSDVHVGPFVGRRFMDELVARTNALKPDLVAITGDLVDGKVHQIGAAVAALGGLRARYGTHFVTGNHEYYSGDVPWVRFLEGLGIGVLRNRSVAIGDAGGHFDLVGVDDWGSRRRGGPSGYDLPRALEGRHPDRAAILLAHQPANFETAAASDVDLQLSGHTHGGQIFPMTALIGLEWKHSAGLYTHGDAKLYVSRGCGFWGPPMRIGSPPEIVKLVLTS